MQKLMSRISNWSITAFGNNRAIPLMHHLKKECDEVISDLENKRDPLKEYADCFILLLNSVSSSGYTMKNLVSAVNKKMDENEKRTWRKSDKNGIIEHMKGK